MPIEKVPVIHKFGIISESRQVELKEKYFNSQRKHFSSSPPNTERRFGYNFDLVEELLYQINNVTDELDNETVEQNVMVWLLKVQHQLLSTHSKPCLDTYNKGWKELSKFTSCVNNKVVYESLLVMKASLKKAPLSKHLIDSLLGICLTNIETFIGDNQHVLFNDQLKLRIEVCFLIVVRLYYHFLVKDVNKKQLGQLEAIYLVSRDIQKNILSLYEENPLFYVTMKVAMVMIEQTCGVLKKVTEEFDEHVGRSEGVQFKSKCLQNSLKVWKSVSRHTRLDEKILQDICELSSFIDTDSKEKWLDCVLSFYMLSECSKINFKYSKLFVQLGSKSKCPVVSQRKVRAPNPTRNNEYSSVERPESLQSVPIVFERIEEFLNPTVTDKYVQAKSQPNSSFLTDENPPKKAACKEQISVSRSVGKINLEDNHQFSWDWETRIVYMKCLADITLNGLTMDIRKLALVGDEHSLGLLDYLSASGDGDSWKVRCCSYQLLYELYHFFMEDSINNTLANVIWDAIKKFEDNENDLSIMKVLKNLAPPKRLKASFDDSLFSKIATNLSIVFLESSSVATRKPCEDKQTEKLNRKKNCTNQKVDKSKTRNMKYITNNKPAPTSYERESWLELQKIVSTQYKREVDEDEEEIEKIRQEINPETLQTP